MPDTTPQELAELLASARCPRGCPEGECYCAEPTYRDFLTCSGCGSDDGACYCRED